MQLKKKGIDTLRQTAFSVHFVARPVGERMNRNILVAAVFQRFATNFDGIVDDA